MRTQKYILVTNYDNSELLKIVTLITLTVTKQEIWRWSYHNLTAAFANLR